MRGLVRQPHVVKNLSVTFDSPQNLTPDSLLLTRSLTLTIDEQSINMYFVCSMHYMLYSYNQVSWREKSAIEKIMLQFCIYKKYIRL